MAKARASKLSRETLQGYWYKLLKLTEHSPREEIEYFQHCTSKRYAESIKEDKRLLGFCTDVPANAPLASCPDVEGVWLHPCTKTLPQKSPFGSRRILMRAMDLLKYVGTRTVEGTADFGEDRLTDSSLEKESTRNYMEEDEQKMKSPQVNEEEAEEEEEGLNGSKGQPGHPLLFFECAHHWTDTQYVRLLLVRPGDPWEQWCRETCLEVDIRHNPFLKIKAGRIFTYKSRGRRSQFIIDVLVIGDIRLDMLEQDPPFWGRVGTLTRAGRDPILGVV